MESYGPISLVLEPQLKWFSTVTFDDTNLLAGGADEDNLPPVGTFDSLDHLLVELHDVRSDLIPKSWESWCRNLVRVARGRRVSGYNKYWEAQIHAPINLKDDVVFVRASYQNLFGKEVGGKVQAWARRNGWPLIWGYKSNVLVDPTVKPESNVSHTDEWRWAHVFTSKRQLASAIRIFEENWKNCATEKMNIDGNEELFPQEKTREYEDFLKARWAGFWGDMPTGLRAEPATGADRESLPGTLHRMRLKPAA
jgi:hypothetical protein